MEKRVKVKTKQYYVRINGETAINFDSLASARKYVKKTYSKVVPNSILPSSVEIIKQLIVEEVMEVFTPKPMQILMVSDLDKDMF